MDDDDWNVYRDIQKDRFSEDEEDDQQALNEVEEKIGELDGEFGIMLYHTGPPGLGGHRPPTAEDYQIRLWADRYRGAEILFQPSIVGLECAGLSEALELLIAQIPNEQKQNILKNVVVLGGNSLVPGFDARIKHELTMINRIGTNIKIVNEYNPDDMDKFAGRPIQPWLGAAKLAKLWQLGNQDW